MSIKKIYQDKLEIPGNIQLELENSLLKIKAEKGELQKQLLLPKVSVKKQDNLLTFSSKFSSKREKRIINTYKSIIRSMFKGVTEGFTYKLKICSGHFPMTVEVQNKELIIKNFFGEKTPRKAKILGNTNVAVNGDEIIVESIDKEAAGQTAANIERATKIRKRDKRVFQDGCYLTEKGGKPIK